LVALQEKLPELEERSRQAIRELEQERDGNRLLVADLRRQLGTTLASAVAVNLPILRLTGEAQVRAAGVRSGWSSHRTCNEWR
jgi:hypothetical protein